MGKIGNYAEYHGGVWMLVSYTIGGDVILVTASTLKGLQRKVMRAGWMIDHVEEV